MSERTPQGFIDGINSVLTNPLNVDQENEFRSIIQKTGDLVWVGVHWNEFLRSAQRYAEKMGQPVNPSWYAAFGENKDLVKAVMDQNVDYLFALGLD